MKTCFYKFWHEKYILDIILKIKACISDMTGFKAILERPNIRNSKSLNMLSRDFKSSSDRFYEYKSLNLKNVWLQYNLELRIGKKIKFCILDLTIVPTKWLSQANGTEPKSKITIVSKSFLQRLRYVERDFEEKNSAKKNWAGRDEVLSAMK